MLKTSEVVGKLEITRAVFLYYARKNKIRPSQKIINGKTQNFYRVADVERLRAILRSNFK